MAYTDQEKLSLSQIWDITQGRGMFRINTDTKRPYSYGHWNPEDYDYDDGGVPRWYAIPPLPFPLFEKHLKENGVFAATPAFWNLAVVDVDDGCPNKTIQHIGVEPIHRCATRRGTHLFYAVPDADSVKHWSARTGEVKDDNGDLIFGGEIASVRRYAKIHAPNDFLTAVSLREMESHPLPPLPDILNTGYAEDKPKSGIIGTTADASDIERQVEEIATKLGLRKDGARWVGGCPECGHGETGTRFQVKAGHSKPLLICRSCSPEGFDKAKIAKVLEQAGQTAPVKESKPDGYKLIDPPFVSTYGIGAPARLLGEACKALGIRFRTNATRNISEIWIDRFTTDRNGETAWKPIDGGIESTLPVLLEWNVKYLDKKGDPVAVNLASTNPKLKDYIGAELYRNQYHPFKEWLDARPAWDGTKRLCTMLSDLGFDPNPGDYDQWTDTPFSKWAESYLIVETIRLNLYPGSDRKSHLVLQGKTNIGKSNVIKRLLPEDLAGPDYINDGFVFVADARAQREQVKGFIVCEGSEFTGASVRDTGRAKSFLSMIGHGGARGVWEKTTDHAFRTDMIYFSTNEESPLTPNDPAMDGRLIMIKLRRQCNRTSTALMPELDGLANPKNPAGGTLRDQLWAEGYALVKSGVRNGRVRNPFMTPEIEAMAHEWNKSLTAHFDTPKTARMSIIEAALEMMAENGDDVDVITRADLLENMYLVETDKYAPSDDAEKHKWEQFREFKNKMDKGEGHSLRNDMKAFGYEYKRTRIDGSMPMAFRKIGLDRRAQNGGHLPNVQMSRRSSDSDATNAHSDATIGKNESDEIDEWAMPDDE